MAAFFQTDDGAPVPAGAPALLRRLQEHFGGDPARLPVVEQHFATYERPNLQLALDELLTGPERKMELLGIVAAASELIFGRAVFRWLAGWGVRDIEEYDFC